MKAFVVRKWWRQLFVVAKQEQQAQAEEGGGDCIASAWRSRVARKAFRAARTMHAGKCRAAAAAVVQRSIKSHAARVAVRNAEAAVAAAGKERELGKALAYEVMTGVAAWGAMLVVTSSRGNVITHTPPIGGMHSPQGSIPSRAIATAALLQSISCNQQANRQKHLNPKPVTDPIHQSHQVVLHRRGVSPQARGGRGGSSDCQEGVGGTEGC